MKWQHVNTRVTDWVIGLATWLATFGAGRISCWRNTRGGYKASSVLFLGWVSVGMSVCVSERGRGGLLLAALTAQVKRRYRHWTNTEVLFTTSLTTFPWQKGGANKLRLHVPSAALCLTGIRPSHEAHGLQQRLLLSNLNWHGAVFSLNTFVQSSEYLNGECIYSTYVASCPILLLGPYHTSSKVEPVSVTVGLLHDMPGM